MLNKYKDLALNDAPDDAVHIKRVEGQNCLSCRANFRYNKINPSSSSSYAEALL